MSDFRTRIVAALLSEDDVALMADAVIRELVLILKPQLDDYEEARRYDADCGEADNSGNEEKL
jgi:hypothetical protein